MTQEPLYLKIYNTIYNDISNGNYAPGDKLPSEKKIAENFDVSRITSKKALEMLAENNLIERIPGKGSFVLESKEKGESANDESKANAKPHMIGLILSDYSESYGLKLVYGVEEETSNKGCVVVSKRTNGNQALENESIDLLIENGVDGILIMPVHGENYNPKILRLILDGFPVVFVDRNLKGISAPFVGTDNVNAAKKASDFLIQSGHRHICFISPPIKGTLTLEDRIAGFIKSHAEFGVAADESIWLTNLTSTMPGQNSKENIENDIRRIQNKLIENSQITCIFAAEYNLAYIAMEAVKRMGLHVPDDISILCFDGPENLFEKDFFTHIRQKEREMGVLAVQLLLKQIDGKGKGKKIFLDSDLILGKSTRSIN